MSDRDVGHGTEEERGYVHVYYDADEVIGYLYERTCGKGRVDVQLLERERHDSAQYGREHHHYE